MDEESNGAVSCRGVVLIPSRHVQAIDMGSSIARRIEGHFNGRTDRRGAARDRRECTIINILSAVG